MSISDPEALWADSIAASHPEFTQSVREGLLAGKFCISCARATEDFFVIAGSPPFYMRTLVALGAPPGMALNMMERNKGNPLRRTPVCASCADKAGFGKPSNMTQVKLLSGPDDKPAPMKILAENDQVMTAAVKMTQKEQEKKGKRMSSKEVQDFLKSEVTARGHTWKNARNGHIRLETADGQFLMNMTSTPSDYRALRNTKSDLRRRERELGLLQEEVKPQEQEPRTGRVRFTPAAKAALVDRYDQLPSGSGEKAALLAEHKIYASDIMRWREKLQKEGTYVVPLPDEPGETRMCITCEQDKARTREFFSVVDVAGKPKRWSDQCIQCGKEPVRTPVAEKPSPSPLPSIPEVKPLPASTSDRAARIIWLVDRKEAIGVRREAITGEIDTLSVQLRALEKEKAELDAELNQAETDLLNLVTG